MKIIYVKHPYGQSKNRKQVKHRLIRIVLSVLLAAVVACCNHLVHIEVKDNGTEVFKKSQRSINMNYKPNINQPNLR